MGFPTKPRCPKCKSPICLCPTPKGAKKPGPYRTASKADLIKRNVALLSEVAMWRSRVGAATHAASETERSAAAWKARAEKAEVALARFADDAQNYIATHGIGTPGQDVFAAIRDEADEQRERARKAEAQRDLAVDGRTAVNAQIRAALERAEKAEAALNSRNATVTMAPGDYRAAVEPEPWARAFAAELVRRVTYGELSHAIREAIAAADRATGWK